MIRSPLGLEQPDFHECHFHETGTSCECAIPTLRRSRHGQTHWQYVLTFPDGDTMTFVIQDGPENERFLSDAPPCKREGF